MTFTDAQHEQLKDEKRFAIYTFLTEQKKPQSQGEIGRGIDLRDPAKVFRHIAILVDVGVVEQVPGTRKYRLVGSE
jgi:DNA-binding IclR family transcriptional regulator